MPDRFDRILFTGVDSHFSFPHFLSAAEKNLNPSAARRTKQEGPNLSLVGFFPQELMHQFCLHVRTTFGICLDVYGKQDGSAFFESM